MRILYFSPLPPVASGIADYSAELLPYLSRHFDITLCVAENSTVSPVLSECCEIMNAPFKPTDADAFDAVVYHMGNDNRFHGYIYDALQLVPGIVVAHETVYYHSLHFRTVGQGDLDGFRRLLTQTYGELRAERAFDQLDDWDRNPQAFPLFAPTLANAVGVIVHSKYAREQVQRCRPDLPVAVIPHHLSLPSIETDLGTADALPSGSQSHVNHQRLELRRQLGLDAKFVVGSFGYVTKSKRPAVMLRAFARFHRDNPDALCCIVGDVAPEIDMPALIAELELPQSAVIVTGRVTLEDFIRYMQAMDVAVNLRLPTNGEASGALIRLLGLGVPTVVSDVDAFAELPDDCCVKVPTDALEEDTLYAVLTAFSEDETLPAAIGMNARRHIGDHHTLEGSAHAYFRFIEQIVSGTAEPVGPLEDFAVSEVLSGLGATLAGWGVTERHDTLLRPIAQALADLGM